MAFDFPASPAAGQEYTSAGVTYVWQAPVWRMKLSANDNSPAPPTIAAPAKPGPADVDLFGYVDASTSGWVKATWANLKDNLTAIFNALYLKLSGGTMTGELKFDAGMGGNSYRLKNNASPARGVFQRIDAGSWYLLTTADDDPDGSWSMPLALSLNLATKKFAFGGEVAFNGALSGSAVATYVQYQANTPNKMLTTDQVWASAAVVGLAYAASVTLNFAAGINFQIATINGPLTLPNPTGMKVGQSGYVRLFGGASSGAGKALTLGTSWYFPVGAQPTTIQGNDDMIFYVVIDSATLFCVYVSYRA